MSKFILDLVCKHENNEGFLEIALKSLIKDGIASEGIDGDNRKLIEILQDEHDNFYLFYKKEDYDLVQNEILKRNILSEFYLENDPITLVRWVDKGNLHEQMQEQYPRNPYLVVNYN